MSACYAENFYYKQFSMVSDSFITDYSLLI